VTEITPVAILDNETLDVLFASQHPMAVDVRESTKITKFTVENGTVRSDHAVVSPVEISIDFVLTGDLAVAFEEIHAAFREQRIVAIQTREKLYFSMIIESLSHGESADTADTVRGALQLTEWKEAEPDIGTLPERKVNKKRQSDTKKTNKKAEEPENTTKKSAAAEVFDGGLDAVKKFFGSGG